MQRTIAFWSDDENTKLVYLLTFYSQATKQNI